MKNQQNGVKASKKQIFVLGVIYVAILIALLVANQNTKVTTEKELELSHLPTTEEMQLMSDAILITADKSLNLAIIYTKFTAQAIALHKTGASELTYKNFGEYYDHIDIEPYQGNICFATSVSLDKPLYLNRRACIPLTSLPHEELERIMHI